MLHLIAPLALTLIPAALPCAEDEKPPELEYSSLAAEFRKAHGLDNAQPESVTLQDLLDSERYRQFNLGLFDIRISAEALQDKAVAKKFVTCALAALDAQSHWVSWTAIDHDQFETITADFEGLHKWVKGWSTSALSAIGKYPDRDIMERLGTSDETRAAHKRVEQFMCRAEFLGIRLHDSPDAQILFAHDRTTMLQLLCFTGWNSHVNRDNYWKKGVEKWTSFWDNGTQVIAMEYPAFPINMEKPGLGADMNEFEKTGLGQHAAEKASTSMFWRYYGDNDALFYEAAMGVELAISVFDENNVRTGAPVFKNLGGSTSAFSVFVPGGNPSGGTLPGRGAISVIEVPLWRETKGSDHYVKPLGKAQKKGNKLARKDKHPNKGKLVHFIVFGPKPNQTSYVTAPFFGPDAEDKELPDDEYLVDYEEFFRAYSASFFHWLKTRGAGKDKALSASLFAKLNSTLATRDENTSFASVIESLYDLPLSGPDGEQDSLEWRFLTYIGKGGR